MGHGERLYLHGPFEEPKDSGHGYQLPLPPREVYRRALRTLDAHCRKTYRDRAFVELPAAKQDEVPLAYRAADGIVNKYRTNPGPLV